jgi:hypothetical protein
MRLLLLLILAATYAFASDPGSSSDTIFLINGDRLTGEIEKLEKEKLFLKTAYAGTVGIEWKKIERINSARQFDVEAQSGLRLRGSLAEAPQGMEVVTDDSRVGISRLNIVGMRPAREGEPEGFWLGVEGAFDVGFSLARGNTNLNQSTLAMRARYRHDGFQVQTDLASLFSRQTDSATLSRHSGSVRVDRYISPQRFLYGIGGMERDDRRKLNLRTNVGGGLGWNAVKSAANEVSLLAGLNFVNEVYRLDDPSILEPKASSGEGMLALDLKNTLSAGMQLVTKVAVQPNLLQAGRYRFSLESGTRMPLIGRYIWTFQIFDRYDSRPPVQALRNDYGAVSSVGVTF